MLSPLPAQMAIVLIVVLSGARASCTSWFEETTTLISTELAKDLEKTGKDERYLSPRRVLIRWTHSSSDRALARVMILPSPDPSNPAGGLDDGVMGSHFSRGCKRSKFSESQTAADHKRVQGEDSR